MVKRAGIEATPSGAVDRVQVETGAEGAMAVARLWRGIAETSDALRKEFQPLANKDAVRKAQAEAAKGNYRQRWGWNEEDLAYNNAVQAAYLAKAQNDIDGRLSQIELEHPEDVEAYVTAAEAAKNEYLKLTPGDYAIAIGGYFDDQSTKGRMRTAARRQASIVKEGEAALRSRLEVLDARNAELLPNDPAWAEYMLDREDLLQAVRNPVYGITDEEIDQNRAETLSKATGNLIGRTARQMYDDAPGAEGAARAEAFLDEQLKRTDLTLTSAQRDQYMGEARRAIRNAETQRKAAERELARNIREARRDLTEDVRDEVESLDTLLDAGAMPPPERINALVSAAEETGRPSLIYKARDLRARHEAVSALKGLDALAAGNKMTEWRAAAEAGDETAARRYNAGVAYLQSAQTQQRTKPLEFLRDHYGEALSPIDTVQGWQARIEQARRASAAAGGVAPQYLLQAEKNVLGALSDNGGDEAFAAAVQIWRAAPANVSREIFREIGPNGPALGYAGMVLSETNDEQSARRILKGQQMLRRAESGGYRQADFKPEQRDPIFERLAPDTLTGTQRADRRRAADLLFEGQYAETGDGSKEAYQRAVETVMGAVRVGNVTFGGVANVRGVRVQAPVWIRQDQFNIVLNSMQPAHYAAASATGRYPMTRAPGGRLERAPLSVLNSMRLVPTGAPGRYYLSAKSAPGADGVWDVAPDEDGQAYILDLNKVRASLAAQRPDAVIPEPANGRR